MIRILIFGAGMVIKPMLEYFKKRGYFITIASKEVENANILLASYSNRQIIRLDITNIAVVDKLVSDATIVISMLPAPLHPVVAKSCIKYKKNMVTTSYESPEIMALDEEVKKAGICIINETGLDPGLDHMSIKRIIDNIHHSGGKVKTLLSFCGALVTAESANNPFKYKFTWSPFGVLNAGLNGAMFLVNKKQIQIPENKVFQSVINLNLRNIGSFEVYPNRDSLKFINIYDVPEAETLIRGTMRHPGWCSLLNDFIHLGLFEKKHIKIPKESTMSEGMTTVFKQYKHKQYIDKVIKEPERAKQVYKALNWLGCFSNDLIEFNARSNFEFIGHTMLKKMKLSAHDEDMIVMFHHIDYHTKDNHARTIQSKLHEIGKLNKQTAVSRTVSLPSAIIVQLLLDKKIGPKGIIRPLSPDIYNPVLEELRNSFHISFTERETSEFGQLAGGLPER